MFTRKDYMSKKVSHNDYYGQFVNDAIVACVKTGIGEKRIKASTDPHFNDIALSNWDNLHWPIRQCCGKTINSANSGGGISLSDTVCIAKQAARIIKGR